MCLLPDPRYNQVGKSNHCSGACPHTCILAGMPAGHLESALWYTGVNTVRGSQDPCTSILLPRARGISRIYTSVSD